MCIWSPPSRRTHVQWRRTCCKRFALAAAAAAARTCSCEDACPVDALAPTRRVFFLRRRVVGANTKAGAANQRSQPRLAALGRMCRDCMTPVTAPVAASPLAPRPGSACAGLSGRNNQVAPQHGGSVHSPHYIILDRLFATL